MWIMCNAHCAVYTPVPVPFFLYITFLFQFLLSIKYSIQFKLHNVHYTMYSILYIFIDYTV